MSQLAAPSHTPPTHQVNGVPSILIVDDEQHMCDVCARMLRRSGYDVITTNDPNVAVGLLQGAQRFDLLLTDIKMPAMSGLDLARIARERDPVIAIIIMTGFASFENMQQSVQRGATDFLAKPFELEQLRLAVEQALQKRAILQDNLRLAALEQLLASSEALSRTLELPELARTLLRVTMQPSGCRAGVVLQGDSEAGLTVVATAPEEVLLLPAGLRLAQQTLQQGQHLSGSEESFGTVEGRELRYAVAVALRAQGDVNGVLLLCDDRTTALRPGVQEELSLIAAHAGAALRNASLYQQLGEAFQRLQELDRLKSEFISIASHELRTPLSLVLGYTMMLRDQSSGVQYDYAHRVMEGAQRIKDIVDDMVSLRHLETGEARLQAEPCALHEVVQRVEERLRKAAETKGHQIVIELPEQPIEFLSDREKITLVLANLLSNAIKFTPNGGSITIRATIRPPGPLTDSTSRLVTPVIAPEGHEQLPWVILEVQDSGIGVPEREQSRIFDRFYQVADSLTRDQGGTGLGLAIVRELVVALNGAVWVTSREGQGSTFAVALPYRQE
ncbi:MAG TPA: ATP-binding protein [Roseiflexaceae bacterium]|nr:ATP-binding protein [Roseiflexaceae bacterium]